MTNGSTILTKTGDGKWLIADGIWPMSHSFELREVAWRDIPHSPAINVAPIVYVPSERRHGAIYILNPPHMAFERRRWVPVLDDIPSGFRSNPIAVVEKSPRPPGDQSLDFVRCAHAARDRKSPSDGAAPDKSGFVVMD